MSRLSDQTEYVGHWMHISLAGENESDSALRSRNLFHVWESLRKEGLSFTSVAEHRIAAKNDLWGKRAITRVNLIFGLDDG